MKEIIIKTKNKIQDSFEDLRLGWNDTKLQNLKI